MELKLMKKSLIKKILFVLVLMLSLTLFGCKDKEKEKKEMFTDEYSYYLSEDALELLKWDWFDKEEFKEMLSDHIYYKNSAEEVRQAIEGKGKCVIYFGFDPNKYQCPYCAASLPIFNEAAKESGIEKILYIDIYEMRKNKTEEYLWFYNYLKSQVSDMGEKIFVPYYFVIEDGKVLSSHLSTITVIDENGKEVDLKGMNSEQKAQLKQIFLDMFKN